MERSSMQYCGVRRGGAVIARGVSFVPCLVTLIRPPVHRLAALVIFRGLAERVSDTAWPSATLQADKHGRFNGNGNARRYVFYEYVPDA
ncbi:hypothetical protein EVAR_56563_1 [Eumeta japonica]|uniref:Uncharacterized protein n=1 Tax=Eumeta variegata TaxID=151549 RepID=A0A4C1ZWL2_EUMVA|nr:hypothetical protein EVAR_56563_1 [Eumeta japonica]